MHEKCSYDYAVIRVVPRVEREEFINVGVILSCPAQKFLEAGIEVNIEKLKSFSPDIDLDMIEKYLSMIKKICDGEKDSGVIGQLPQRSRFYWLTAQRSTIIQTSPIHTGFCFDADKTLENLLNKMVR